MNKYYFKGLQRYQILCVAALFFTRSLLHLSEENRFLFGGSNNKLIALLALAPFYQAIAIL